MSGFLAAPVATVVQYAVGAAPQQTFTVPFAFDDAEDLRAFVGETETSFSVTSTVSVDGFTTSGAITLPAPVANARVTIKRETVLGQDLLYPESGKFRVKPLNREVARLWMGVQDQVARLNQALRSPVWEPALAELPGAAARANKVLGFDGAGGLALVSGLDRSSDTVTPTGGSTGRLLAAWLDDEVRCQAFGAAFDGVTDDGPAIQAAATYAATQGKRLVIGPGTARVNQTITVPGGASGVVMTGRLVSGVTGAAALILGDGGASRNASKVYRGIRVERASQSTWTDEAEIGVVIRNMDASLIEVVQAEGFTIGIRTLGDQRGFEDSTLILGRIANNRIGLDVRAENPGSWNNAVRYIGGHFANASATKPTLDRFGVRFSRGASGYNLHNHHVFEAPAFELQNQGGAVAAIPFLSEVNSRAVVVHQARIEGNSPQVARHTAGAQDHVYEVAFSSNGAITGTEGNAYLLEMDYPAGATRAGGSIIPLHQAAAAIHSPRLIAGVPSLRATAFRWSATEVGFEGLAVLSSNPAGPPTTLAGLAFPGLSGFTLNANSATFPTSRALGFVVDCALCKEFFVAYEGTKLRVMAMLFDAGETVLGNAAVALASNQSMAWQAGPQWWQATADGEDATYTRLQRITVPAAAKLAIVGVTSSDPASELKALRLYCPHIHAPQVLAGGGRRWGTRELVASAAWDPPSIAAGASTTIDVPVADAVPGDFVDAAFSLATALPLDADMPATATVRCRFTNNTGVSVDIGAGTVFVRTVKPRL